MEEQIEDEYIEIDMDTDIVALGIWLDGNDHSFKGFKFWRWLGYTLLILIAQFIVILDVTSELTTAQAKIYDAYHLKKSGKDDELKNRFETTFLENLEDIYELEQNKDSKYIRKTLARFIIALFISAYITRGLSKKA